VPDSTQSEAVRRTIVEVDWQIQRGAPVECDGGAVIRILVAAEGKTRTRRSRDSTSRLKMICRSNGEWDKRVRHGMES
jgi:hypothetical protein